MGASMDIDDGGVAFDYNPMDSQGFIRINSVRLKAYYHLQRKAAEKGGKKQDKAKKVIKEGGKRGVEIEGAADMGGLQFFSTSVDEPDGDLDLLLKSMEAMNQKCDPTEEERKGCSGHVGKMIFSAGEHQLAIVAYIPDEMKKDLDAKVWLQKVLDL